MAQLEDNSSYGMPNCRKCGDNRQVWRNQISGKLKCHRAYCETEVPMEDILEAFIAMQQKLAAAEAVKAQGVPERVTADMWRKLAESQAELLRVHASVESIEALLASTPAPAQQEKSKVISKFTDAVFDLAKNLAGIPPNQPVERKPMTPEQVAETIFEMNGNEPSALFWCDLVSAVERHHGIKE